MSAPGCSTYTRIPPSFIPATATTRCWVLSAPISPSGANEAGNPPTLPNVLQTMAGEASDPSPFLNVGAGGTYIASGVLFILGPLLTGPIAGALPTTSLGF